MNKTLIEKRIVYLFCIHDMILIPFDRTKPLIEKRMASENDPNVRAIVISLPTAAMNLKNAKAIWCTSTRIRYCLKNLHSVVDR
jgi:hypothetical protein